MKLKDRLSWLSLTVLMLIALVLFSATAMSEASKQNWWMVIACAAIALLSALAVVKGSLMEMEIVELEGELKAMEETAQGYSNAITTLTTDLASFTTQQATEEEAKKQL